MVRLLATAKERLASEKIWVNPDRGLKSRRWDEVRPALENMVGAAKQMRQRA
jgi:5-methyltetrahydropteroyltriglutamate--homocysteine methyltransferase